MDCIVVITLRPSVAWTFVVYWPCPERETTRKGVAIPHPDLKDGDSGLREINPFRTRYLFSASNGLRAKENSDNISMPPINTPSQFAKTGWSLRNCILVPQAKQFSGSHS